MADDITVRVTVNADAVADRIADIRKRLRKELPAAARTIGATVEREGKRNAPVRRGTLRRSIHRSRLITRGLRWSLSVMPSVDYGRLVENGFHGQQQVRAHQRRTRAGNSVEVRAHTRQVDRPARPYMGPARTTADRTVPGVMTDAVRRAIHG